jgi:putative FmdB family regulatory protein
MPIREYIAKDPAAGCDQCRDGFEVLETIEAKAATVCPACGTPIQRRISAPRVGRSQSGMDDRAKAAGFTKLKRVSKGEYEKEY